MKRKFYIIWFILIFSIRATISSKERIISLNKPTPYRIVVATMQKTGSHLINKCVYLITGKNTKSQLNKVNWNTDFYWVHSVPNSSSWRDKNYRLLTIVRDPRDHIISIMRHNQPPFNKIFTFEQIQEGITAYLTNFANAYAHYHGGQSTIGGGRYGTTLNQIWAPFVNLLNNPNVYAARFERLVGPEGYRSIREDHFEEINNIANFIGISLTEEEIVYVADHIYGDTSTFVAGGHGMWKQYFTENHKKLCKQNGNKVLIQLGYEHDDNW